MRILTLIVLAITITLNTYSQEAKTHCDTSIVCVVTNINGSCVLREGDKVQAPTLTSKNAIGKKLRAGQEFQCSSGGYVRVFFCKSLQEIEIKGNPKKWYTVPNVPGSVPEDGDHQIRGRERPPKRVAAYLGIPGREDFNALMRPYALMERMTAAIANNANVIRTDVGEVADRSSTPTSSGGEPVAFVFPSPYAKVWPENLIFRWHPTSNKSTLSFSIHTVRGDLVWAKSGVDSRIGQLSSTEARAALDGFRAIYPGDSFIVTVLRDGVILRNFTTSVLSVQDEATLKQELSEVDKEKDFLFHIYRADAFYRHELYFDEASEYEIVLNSSPESEDLLLAALVANCRAGNIERAFLLTARLPPDHPYRFARCTR